VDRAGLIYFGEVHTVRVLQPGDLPRMELHFQICRHDRDVDGLTLRRVGALGANAVKLNVPVMGLHEFINDIVHGSFIVLGVS